MENVAGFPFLPLEFKKDGTPNAAQKAALLAALGNGMGKTTDLFVLSHGWNNDMAEARQLYKDLLGHIRPRLDARHPPGGERRFAVLGIFWPSKKFADADLIPGGGGAAGLGEPAFPGAVLRTEIERLGELVGAGDAEVAALKARAETIEDGPAAEQAFVEALRALLPASTDTADDRSDVLFDADGDQIIEALRAPVEIIPPQGEVGGAASVGMIAEGPIDGEGAAASLGSLFAGAGAAAWRLLNYSTYYVMKERAGTVGTALNAVLGEVRGQKDALHLHLVGHSFGARVVTAAANGPQPIRPASLCLLQGAFSHNGFAADIEGQIGFFRQVVAGHKVAGPIIATHTQNDMAVGVAYAIASRLSNDVASAFGGPGDIYGGLGRNGALRMGADEAVAAALEDGAFAYPPFAAGKIQNLQADAFIAGHNEVANGAVANAIVHATG